jgi:hypothetical protein
VRRKYFCAFENAHARQLEQQHPGRTRIYTGILRRVLASYPLGLAYLVHVFEQSRLLNRNLVFFHLGLRGYGNQTIPHCASNTQPMPVCHSEQANYRRD